VVPIALPPTVRPSDPVLLPALTNLVHATTL
jgi:hypothetical protein